MVTSEPVLVEVLASFAKHGPVLRDAATHLLNILRASADVQIEPQTHELFEAGADLYRRRRDKDYSLTDCMSMQIARTMSITDIATHDDGFRQEGFKILFP